MTDEQRDEILLSNQRILQELLLSNQTLIKSFYDFKGEMYEFRDGMYEFKDEMYEFKDEMYEFKDEMYSFKDEMYSFKDEMYKFRDDITARVVKLEESMNDLPSILQGIMKHQERDIRAVNNRIDEKIKYLNK